MADDLDALLASAGESPPFVLVGGSFGGLLDGWAAAQTRTTRLAALSRRGVHIVAQNNGHSLVVENPKLAAAAIQAVVRAARGEPFDVSEVRRLATAVPYVTRVALRATGGAG